MHTDVTWNINLASFWPKYVIHFLGQSSDDCDEERLDQGKSSIQDLRTLQLLFPVTTTYSRIGSRIALSQLERL
jgi:hypothetical protein